MVKGDSGAGPDLVSPATFAHGGASGCTLQVDPINDISVAYVSNRHANTGRPPFMARLSKVVNVAVACLTRRG
jgi:CubicO group peptidase (beta-lactamase class C family)